jgi:Contractile injection system tube protein
MRLAPRSRITKGKLGGLSFMYNPSTFTDSQSVNWVDLTTAGMTYPEMVYGGGNTRTITFTIFVSDKIQPGITKRFKDHLQKYLPPKRSSAYNFKSPPNIQFAFGWFVVDCKLLTLDFEHTKFSPSLQPIEGNITVTLNVIQ